MKRINNGQTVDTSPIKNRRGYTPQSSDAEIFFIQSLDIRRKKMWKEVCNLCNITICGTQKPEANRHAKIVNSKRYVFVVFFFYFKIFWGHLVCAHNGPGRICVFLTLSWTDIVTSEIKNIGRVYWVHKRQSLKNDAIAYIIPDKYSIRCVISI